MNLTKFCAMLKKLNMPASQKLYYFLQEKVKEKPHSFQDLGFPMNVIALLPYMVQHYEDANDLCILSAENIAVVSSEKNKKLENLATVMTLYSRRTFSKESFQWTKCVVKYLHDLYSRYSFNMLSFLVEVLEKGPSTTQVNKVHKFWEGHKIRR